MSTPEDPDAGWQDLGPASDRGATAGGGGESESAAAQRSAQRRREREHPAQRAPNMLPGRARRRFGLERFVVRLVATGGVVGIGVALGAILAAAKVQGWITGLVVAVVSVILSATLWSSRQL